MKSIRKKFTTEQSEEWGQFIKANPKLKKRKDIRKIFGLMDEIFMKRDDVDHDLIRYHLTKESDSSGELHLVIPYTQYNKATRMHFELGWQLGKEIEKLHLLQIDKVVEYLEKKGSIPQQVVNRINDAMKEVLEDGKGLGKIRITKNLSEMVGEKLKEWEIDTIDPKTIAKLAKEFKTTVGSINDAIHKMRRK